jgi:hypothetical protein
MPPSVLLVRRISQVLIFWDYSRTTDLRQSSRVGQLAFASAQLDQSPWKVLWRNTFRSTSTSHKCRQNDCWERLPRVGNVVENQHAHKYPHMVIHLLLRLWWKQGRRSRSVGGTFEGKRTKTPTSVGPRTKTPTSVGPRHPPPSRRADGRPNGPRPHSALRPRHPPS